MATVIEKALKSFPPEQRAVLLQVRDTLAELLPGCEEGIAWGMPAFKNAGVSFICFQGFKRHNSIFPMSATVSTRLKSELTKYSVSKGTIQFDLDKPVPKALLRKILETRISEINESYPRSSGEFLCFYANGVLQSKGRYKGTKMHGDWTWYRKDGSKMRSGSFKDGEQVGAWITYDRSGKPVKTTHFA